MKANVEQGHHVLEIGSGWGTLAIEVVKRTSCKYTGITLSEEQLKYAQRKVKEAGLEVTLLYFSNIFSIKNIFFCWFSWHRQQIKYTILLFLNSQYISNGKELRVSKVLLFFQDHITFLLCDYRQIPMGHKYDRIISWWVRTGTQKTLKDLSCTSYI